MFADDRYTVTLGDLTTGHPGQMLGTEGKCLDYVILIHIIQVLA